jgi:Ni/Co efflux regulator RcnB
MKKIVLAAVAATMALTGVMSADVAAAQPNHYDRDHHDDRGDHRNNRGDHHDNRGGDRDHRNWDRGHSNWNRQYSQDRWQGNHRYYGGRYGYNGYHGRWRTGERYPYWRDNRYVINDYRYYRLPPPRAGYRYYRDDNGDIVMAAIASGAIGLIVGSALSN